MAMPIPTTRMAAMKHCRHEGEKLRELSAYPFSGALLSSLHLERPSSASVGWVGFGGVARLSFQTSSGPGSLFQSAPAILSTPIPTSVADSGRLLYLPWRSTPSLSGMPTPLKWVRRKLT